MTAPHVIREQAAIICAVKASSGRVYLSRRRIRRALGFSFLASNLADRALRAVGYYRALRPRSRIKPALAEAMIRCGEIR